MTETRAEYHTAQTTVAQATARTVTRHHGSDWGYRIFQCPECGRDIAENWYVRHLNACTQTDTDSTANVSEASPFWVDSSEDLVFIE